MPAAAGRDPALLLECRALIEAFRRHPTLAALHAAPEWPDLGRRVRAVLSTLRRFAPPAGPAPPRDPARIRVVHWNIEHGNWYPQVERALCEHPALAGADILTLNEVDLGMGRAGNRDVAAELSAALSMHAAWAPLFLETTPGRHDDAHAAAGRENQESLFGLALLSRWPIGAARIVELPGPERFQYDTEGMYGRFIALVATIERPASPFTAVSVHLEVHRRRIDRARQMQVLMEALRDERGPVILGGDLNTHTFDRGAWWHPMIGALVLSTWPGPLLARRLTRPDRGPAREPLFEVLREAGFEWRRYADDQPTLHLRFVRVPEAGGPLGWPFARPLLARGERRAHLRLDWLAGRGWPGGSGSTVTGLHGPGRASDHAPIVGEFW